MLERLRMQEVSQIIFSVPEGAIIAGTDLQVNEPVMIIEKPAMSASSAADISDVIFSSMYSILL